MITSKPAIYDHFKSGQRSRTQDMKLFYRASGSLSKLLLILPLIHRMLGPDQREGAEMVVFFLNRNFWV